MKDIALKSVYIGLIGVLIKDLFDRLYMALGFSGISMAKVAAGSFVAVDSLSTTAALIIGYTAHFTVGGILGLLFLSFLLITGTRYNMQKGIFFGLVVWLLLSGVGLRLGISNYFPQNTSSVLMLLFDHIVFGLTLGYLIPRIALAGNEERQSLLKTVQPAFKLLRTNKDKA